MTAPTMSEEERTEAIVAAQEIVDTYEAYCNSGMLEGRDERALVNAKRKAPTVARALLSTSSALREMREALEGVLPFLDDLDDGAASVGVYPDVACAKRCRDAVAAARAAIAKAPKPQPRSTQEK